MVERHSRPSPESAKDPTRRRTEIYMRNEDLTEHIKLRQHADHELNLIDKLRQESEERSSDDTTERKVNELIAANAATQAAISAMATESSSMKTMLTQLMGYLPFATANQTDNCTEQKTELKTEPNDKQKTETNSDKTEQPTSDLTTEMMHMGVLTDSDDTVLYSHDMPETALFTELENSNALMYTDYLQNCDTDQRRTVDPFSLYLYYTAHDQGCVIKRIENLFQQKISAHAYKASSKTLIEELSNFSNPAQHTRIMVFLRALIFSADETTKTTTADMIRAYMATQTDELGSLQEHVIRHGAPPCVPHSSSMTTIAGSPGLSRLSAADNPKYYERCLGNLFHMVVECNSRICVHGLDTAAAELEYANTQPGQNYAETKTNEDQAWAQLCRVHGNGRPTTDFKRIECLLALCEQYQGHTKTRRALLKVLHGRGISLTNVSYGDALPIIGTAARFEDELSAQMGTSATQKAAVLTTGVTGRQGQRTARVGAGRGPETCKICEKPGHNAHDCLLFMQREGTCGHWFMHSIGIYDTGCSYGATCKLKHARPSIKPPENAVGADQAAATPISSMSTVAKRVSVMATGASPEAHGGEYSLKELTVSDMES